MNVIKAEVSREKKSKKITYSFNVDNNAFTVNFFHTRKPSFEITHNGALLGKTDEINKKFDYMVDSEKGPIKITAWTHYRNGRTDSVNVLGIEVNGKPVQHTTADPEVHIKQGRVWLWVFLPFLLLQTVLTYIYALENFLSAEYTSKMTALQPYVFAGLLSAVYFIPFLLVLITAIKYKTRTTLALLLGIIISVLDMISCVLVYIFFTAYAVGFIITFIIQIRILWELCEAFNWKRKQIKAGLL